MCIYITGTFPTEFDTKEIADLAGKYGLVINPLANRYIESQLPQGEKYYSLTGGGCDCDTGLGSHHYVYMRFEHPEYKEMSNSEWDDHLKKMEDLGIDFHGRNMTLTKDAERWLNIIKETVENKSTDRFGLLIHFYTGGGISNEKFNIKDIVRKNILEIDREFLIRLEEDILYQFTN